jgi:hypothetical protein
MHFLGTQAKVVDTFDGSPVVTTLFLPTYTSFNANFYQWRLGLLKTVLHRCDLLSLRNVNVSAMHLAITGQVSLLMCLWLCSRIRMKE